MAMTHSLGGVQACQADTLPAARLSIRNLTFHYGSFQALKGISLDVPDGRVTAVIGPSGGGKSTLLRVLNRMHDLYPNRRTTGEVLLDGANIVDPQTDPTALRARIGMVVQTPTPFIMSIYDNIAFGVRLHERLSNAAMDERVEWSLSRSALWPEVKDRLRTPAARLSLGQQQRLCVARCIALRCEVIMLDEPTSELDQISTTRIEDLIEALKDGTTILLVTQNLHQAARCADQVAFLCAGEIVETGPPERILAAPQEQLTRDYINGRFG